MTQAVAQLLSTGRLQEAEWLIRQGASSPVSLRRLAHDLDTGLDPESFFVSAGYYAPFQSWSDAASLCGEAYQSDSVLDSYRRIALNNSTQNVAKINCNPYALRQLASLQHAWLALGRPQTLRVFDFGGALGNHFHALVHSFPWATLQWTVCETASVAAVGKSEFEIDMPQGHQLRFVDKPDYILDQDVDLVMASCSLQYVENWLSLLKIFSSSPWVLLDRVPLIDQDTDLFAVQVVPAHFFDARIPLTFCSSSHWLSSLRDLGYRTVFDWRVPEDQWGVLDLSTGKFRWSSTCNFGFLLSSYPLGSTPVVF